MKTSKIKALGIMLLIMLPICFSFAQLPHWSADSVFFESTIEIQALSQTEISDAEKDFTNGYTPLPNGIIRELKVDTYDFQSFKGRSFITFSCKNALGMAFYIKVLPEAQKQTYMAFNAERTAWHRNLKPDENGLLVVPPLAGSAICIMVENAAMPFASSIACSRLYRQVSGLPGLDNFGVSGACQVNANCSEGNAFRTFQKAVTRIFVRIGTTTTYCTGTLMNNSALDGKPYILTARHCALIGPNLVPPSDFDGWVFYFNYESPNCSNPGSEGNLASQFITGSIVRADSDDGQFVSGSDFLLLELKQAVPPSFKAVYAGWDARNTLPDKGVSIHHPNADIKKISTFSNTPNLIEFGTVPNSHFEVQWVSTSNGFGTTEPGSSGAALFDSKGRVIGTLSGGQSSCIRLTEPDYYGRMFAHWASNGIEARYRLAPWLDPIGGNQFLDALDPLLNSNTHFSTATLPRFYPNPAATFIHIENAEKACVFHISGKSYGCHENLDSRTTMYVEDLPAGAYIIQLQQNGFFTNQHLNIIR